MTDHKVCLICIDGWGVAPPGPGNAITNANTPVMRGLKESGLSCEIDASGLSVGLPAGLMGNSEGNPTPNPDDPNHKLNHASPSVGHMHIGSGRRDYGGVYDGWKGARRRITGHPLGGRQPLYTRARVAGAARRRSAVS